MRRSSAARRRFHRLVSVAATMAAGVARAASPTPVPLVPPAGLDAASAEWTAGRVTADGQVWGVERGDPAGHRPPAILHWASPTATPTITRAVGLTGVITVFVISQNDRGDAFATVEAGAQRQAGVVIRADGKSRQLPPPAAATGPFEQGQVDPAGVAWVSSTGNPPFIGGIAADGTSSPLALPPGATYPDALGISPNGRWVVGVVVVSQTPQSVARPARWDASTPTLSPTLGGDKTSEGAAVAVNDSGAFAGHVEARNGTSRPMRWDASGAATMLSLPQPEFREGSADSIDAAGRVGGSVKPYDPARADELAAVWERDGTLVVLDTLVASTAPIRPTGSARVNGTYVLLPQSTGRANRLRCPSVLVLPVPPTR